MSDVGIFIKDAGDFDLQIKDGDLEKDAGLRTAVLISLFTDKRVTDEELPRGQESKRGWWGDMFPSVDRDQIGSKLWTLAREKRTIETLRRGEDYAREALQWLLDDGIASAVEVSAEFQDEIAIGFWKITVIIEKPSGSVSRYEQLWDQERARGR